MSNIKNKKKKKNSKYVSLFTLKCERKRIPCNQRSNFSSNHKWCELLSMPKTLSIGTSFSNQNQ